MDNIKAHILWVYEHFNGPACGVCLYKEEKLWFCRRELLEQFPQNGKEFVLLRLDKEIMNTLEEEQRKYCEISGEPFNYGEPRKRRAIPFTNKSNFGIIAKEFVELETERKTMLQANKMIRTINIAEIKGEQITVLENQDFDNYTITHKIM